MSTSITTKNEETKLAETRTKLSERVLPHFNTLSELMDGAALRYAQREALGVKKVARI